LTGLEHAILALQQTLDAPRRSHVWRRLVRHRLAAVEEALGSDVAREEDAWLSAREQAVHRQQKALLARLAVLGEQVLDRADLEPVRAALRRLVVDLEHHRQHLNDLVYDSVSLELGGSE
jgi:hypothetical protein